MAIMQVAAEFRDDDRLARRDFREARVGFAQLEAQAFCSVPRHRCNWPVGAQCDPIAIVFPGEIIFERVPFPLWLIEPVYVPDPLQIVRAFRAYQIDNVPICRDVAPWARAGAAIPFAVPAKPFPIRFGPPLYQNGRSEALRF